jgi:hypothetical protein
VGEVRAYTATTVVLTDGRELPIDAVILATGYDLHLPYLSDDLRRAVNLDHKFLDLHDFTFHPALPNVAFMGMFEQFGSYFVSAELQARWIAACWSGVCALPGARAMAAGLAEFQQFRQHRGLTTCQEVAELFSTNLDVAPSLARYPELAQELFFGMLAPAQFRMEGHGRQPDACARFERNVRFFNAGQPMPLTPQHLIELQGLATLLPQHQGLQQLMKQLVAEPIM